MKTASQLRDLFFRGALSTPQEKGKTSPNSRILPVPSNQFGGAELLKATSMGFSSNDINQFLRETGVKASGSEFQVGGMADFSRSMYDQGGFRGGTKQGLYWQVSPEFTAPPAPKESTVRAPDYGNTINKTIALPNNGVGTIETINPLPAAASAPAPILGDPLGEGSQRVSRQKARLSIAK